MPYHRARAGRGAEGRAALLPLAPHRPLGGVEGHGGHARAGHPPPPALSSHQAPPVGPGAPLGAPHAPHVPIPRLRAQGVSWRLPRRAASPSPSRRTTRVRGRLPRARARPLHPGAQSPEDDEGRCGVCAGAARGLPRGFPCTSFALFHRVSRTVQGMQGLLWESYMKRMERCVMGEDKIFCAPVI